jgi:hypothetical protein
MVISHAACVAARLVDSSFACWPFLARHSRGVRANIDLELHKLCHLQQPCLYKVSFHHGPKHPQHKVIIRPTPQLTRSIICPLVRLFFGCYYIDICSTTKPCYIQWINHRPTYNFSQCKILCNTYTRGLVKNKFERHITSKKQVSADCDWIKWTFLFTDMRLYCQTNRHFSPSNKQLYLLYFATLCPTPFRRFSSLSLTPLLSCTGFLQLLVWLTRTDLYFILFLTYFC